MRSRSQSPLRSRSPSRSSPIRSFSPSRGSVSPTRGIMSPARANLSPGRRNSPSRLSPARVRFANGTNIFYEGDLVEVLNGGGTWVTARVVSLNGDSSYDVRYEDGFQDRGIDSTRIRHIGRTYGGQFNRDYGIGERVEARYRGAGKYYPGIVARVNPDKSYEIIFDFGETFTVDRSSIRQFSQNVGRYGDYGSYVQEHDFGNYGGFGSLGQYREKQLGFFGENFGNFYGGNGYGYEPNGSFGSKFDRRFGYGSEYGNGGFGGYHRPSGNNRIFNNFDNNSGGRRYGNIQNDFHNRFDRNRYGGNYGSYGGRNGWNGDFGEYGNGFPYGPGDTLAPYYGAEYGGFGNTFNSRSNFGPEFKPFTVGSLVEVQSTRNGGRWLPGRITLCNEEEKSYDVELEDGTSEPNIPERSIRWRDGYGTNYNGSGNYRPGTLVEARYRGSTKYSPGVIEACRPDDTYDIVFSDGTTERGIKQEMMRPVANYGNGGAGGGFSGNGFGNGGFGFGMIGGAFGQREYMMRGAGMKNGWGNGSFNRFGAGFDMIDGYGMYGPRNFPSMISGSPTETGFGVFYAREAYAEQWCPIVAYIYDVFQEYFFRYQSQRRHSGFEKMYGLAGEGNHFSSPGYLPPGCEVTIVPSSEWCDFSGGEPTIGRVVWNGWRVSCPFFFKPRQGAPSTFVIKMYFFVRAVLVSEVTFEIALGDATARGRSSILPDVANGAPGAPVFGSFGSDGYGPRNGFNNPQARNPNMNGDSLGFFDMPGGDRRSPMFRNVFLIHTDNDEGFEMLMAETLVTIPGMTIHRRDPNSRISEMYIRTSDRVQIIYSRGGNRQFSSETAFDIRSVQTTLVTPEERVRKMMLTFADYPITPPQEIERLPGCNYSFNPELSIYRWIQFSDERQVDLRQRLYESTRAITKAFMEVCDRPLPFGMIILAGGSDYFTQGNYNNDSGLATSPWNLFFMCEDHASQTMRDEFAHQPIEMRFDPQFFVEAYPFLKATVAILMYCRLTSTENVPYFPTPFNIYGLSKRFDENMLIDMANFYDEQAREYRSQYLQNGFHGYGNEFGPGRSMSDGYQGGRRSYSDRDDYDGYGPYQRLRGNGDFLANTVQYAESALSSIHQWGLGRSARKVRSRLDEIAPTWLQQCDMRPMEFDLKVWWVSPLSYDLRWKNLHMMVCPPGTPGYQQYLQLSSSSNGVYNGRSAEPFDLDYQNSYFYQQQGRNINNAYRGPMTEISGRMMSELGVRDFSVANEVAMRLSQEGCESWDDVLRLDEFVGSKGSFDDVKWFLRDIGLPMVIASKLMLMMKNYRGAAMNGRF